MEAFMLRIGSGVVLAVALGVGLAPSAFGQETKSARGNVTAIGVASVSVKAGERELTFTVDQKTVLTASGAGTASRRADAANKPGPTIADFVKVGDAVDVEYQEMGPSMRATNIRRISSAGGGGTTDDRPMTSSGTVASISGSIVTISGSAGGGGTFTQSYTLNRETRVVAVGAGTAAAAKGGTLAITDAVGVGDQVTVTYRKAGTALHAEEVRVTAKKK
jgi:hypothetical protein